MKLRTLFTTLVLTSLTATAQTYRNDFADFSQSETELLLKSLSEDDIEMYLVEYGLMENGRLTNTRKCPKSTEKWVLTGTSMIHFNTGDGTCMYDARIADGRIYLTNQKKFAPGSSSKVISTNPGYNGWFKVIGARKDDCILTVDNFNTYRIFKLYEAIDYDVFDFF